jgi:DNA repair exonuclease SbcCD ATPase subunit
LAGCAERGNLLLGIKKTKIKMTEIKDMGQNGELQKLEEFVEKLLSRSNLLRQQKARLETELAERDRLIAELRESLAAQDSERSEVNDRLSKIVDQIEEWELDLDEEKVESAPAEAAEELDEDPAGEDEDAPPVKGQHNLFSVAGGKS